MIHILGLPTDTTFLHLLHHARRLELKSIRPTNLMALVEQGDWKIQPGASATFKTAEGSWVIEQEEPIFCRLSNLSKRCDSDAVQRRWDNFVAGFSAFCALHRGIVFNRPFVGADNGAKPLHEHRLRDLGFLVPESLTSARAKRLQEFCRRGPTVAKTISGTRATCVSVTDKDFIDYNCGRGPVHLQRRVYGPDIRAHVVHDEVFAVQMNTEHVDYRNHALSGKIKFIELPKHLQRQLVDATQSIGLLLAGWDLKIDERGEPWVLEVNPMPGYDGYDVECDGAISKKILAVMRSADRLAD